MTIKDHPISEEMCLPKEFVGRGEVKNFKFRYHIGNSRAFIYEVIKEGRPPYYEVFRAVWSSRFGKYKYPTSKSFGKWAWWCPTLDKALQKYNEL